MKLGNCINDKPNKEVILSPKSQTELFLTADRRPRTTPTKVDMLYKMLQRRVRLPLKSQFMSDFFVSHWSFNLAILGKL